MGDLLHRGEMITSVGRGGNAHEQAGQCISWLQKGENRTIVVIAKHQTVDLIEDIDVLEEMEGRLGVWNAQGPEWKEEEGESSLTGVKVEAGRDGWSMELERATLGEIALIAKDRVRKLGHA